MFTGQWLLIVNPYMLIETVQSFSVLEALFVLSIRINEKIAFWFRFLVMSLWRDLNGDFEFSATQRTEFLLMQVLYWTCFLKDCLYFLWRYLWAFSVVEKVGLKFWNKRVVIKDVSQSKVFFNRAQLLVWLSFWALLATHPLNIHCAQLPCVT